MSRYVDISPYEKCRIVSNPEDNGFPVSELPTVDAIEQLVKERDAAIADIEKYCRYCIVCKNADFTDGYRHNRCRKCLDEENRYFEWRGVQEVEHEVD